MNKSFDLRKSCHVNTNEDGDRFVGVKADTKNAVVYFPLGYQLPDDDRLLRRDIRALFGILSTFNYKEDKMIRGKKFVQAHPVDFPIQAFIDVIDYFMENNGHYYVETEKRYKVDTKGKINWKRTTKSQRAFIKDGQPIYTKFEVECQSPLDNQLITQIHKYCVYIAYQRLGWLYTNQQINNPGIALNSSNKRVFLAELQRKYNDTNKDRDKRLFKSMKAMIEFIDDRVLDKSYYFGTDNFEYVWEKLIDRVFGISNKEDYFPNAVWTERHGVNKTTETRALMPDTIMIYRDNSGKEKIYVLDAKYYRYGDTHKSEHLPDSSSINKQITYGEYIKNEKKTPNDSLFNAFLMPFNSVDNLFETSDIYFNAAESYGKWRMNTENYEKIQGILIDVRYLLHNYLGNHDEDKRKLAEAIEQYIVTH